MARAFSRYVVASIIVAVACSLTLVGGSSQGTASLRVVSAAGVGDPVATSIPEPLDIASDKVMAYIAIPDLAATVERIETVGAAFAPPGELQPGMLKMQVGGMLGDPNLTHLDGAMPLVIMVFKTDTPIEPPSVAGFMSHAEGSPYGEALTAMGMQSNVKDGVLTLAKTPEALAVAGEAVSAYRKIAAAGIKSNLRVTLHIGRLMETYGALVQAQVDQMAGMIPLISPMGEDSATPNQGAQLGKVLKLEANAIFALLDQIEVIQYDVNLSADAIGVDEIFKAKPGTAMADLLSGGPAGKNRSLALLSEPGVMTIGAQLDPKKLSAFIVQILNQLSKNPDAAELLTPELIDIYTDLGECYSGDMAFTMRRLGGAPFAFESVMGVKDEAKVLELMEKGMSLLSPASGFGKMYADMGMEFSVALERDVRNHAGVAVHRIKTAIDMENIPEAQAAPIKAMLKGTEFAFARGYYLGSQDPAALDKMIDRALAGETSEGVRLHAKELFGEGQHFYLDFDFIGLMKAAMAFVPQDVPNPMAAILGGVTSGEPIAAAVSCASGRARAQVKIPLSPFIQIAKAAQQGS